MKFCILTRPRSGSHMLASALDSHPDIQCKGEPYHPDRYPWLGEKPADIQGEIIHCKYVIKGYINLDDYDKIIVLLRDLSKRKMYKDEGKVRHFTEPTTVERIDGHPIQPRHTVQDLMACVGDRDHTVINYEDLLNYRDRDIRVLPSGYGRHLCGFLGVEYQPLKTSFYKPEAA